VAIEVPRDVITVSIVDQRVAEASQRPQERQDCFRERLSCDLLFIEEKMCLHFFFLAVELYIDILLKRRYNCRQVIFEDIFLCLKQSPQTLESDISQ
jgi:hypothetical protein